MAMPLFGKKEELKELPRHIEPTEKVVAKKVYLIPDEPTVQVYGMEETIKSQLLGKEVVAGTLIEIETMPGLPFDEKVLKKIGGAPKVRFKVWKVKPESRGIVSEETKIIIEGRISKVDMEAFIDKCLGILILLEEEASMPVGYSELRHFVKGDVDLRKLDIQTKSKLLDLLYEIEENCLKAILDRNQGYLGIRALECVHKLRGILEGRS
ncbi:hypothetical protein E3E26_06920 [Thermococcus sp. LS1]|uniref:hypothetical protein n=1 Tax=Thermococcus sp. LS1 TaxID=1638259 RepID=UPI00143C347D|nr:hypothetical protein [Thermococcus sp. LS1]NJD99515.1 hypothetical protein [Thermococcus sp. LS1]